MPDELPSPIGTLPAEILTHIARNLTTRNDQMAFTATSALFSSIGKANYNFSPSEINYINVLNSKIENYQAATITTVTLADEFECKSKIIHSTISIDGNKVAIAYEDGHLYIRDQVAKKAKFIHFPEQQYGKIATLLFSPTADILVISYYKAPSAPFSYCFYNIETINDRIALWTLIPPHESSVPPSLILLMSNIAFAPNGKWIVLCAKHKSNQYTIDKLDFYDPYSGQKIFRIPFELYFQRQLVISPDSQQLAFISGVDKHTKLTVINLNLIRDLPANYQIINDFPTYNQNIVAVNFFSPDKLVFVLHDYGWEKIGLIDIFSKAIQWCSHLICDHEETQLISVSNSKKLFARLTERGVYLIEFHFVENSSKVVKSWFISHLNEYKFNINMVFTKQSELLIIRCPTQEVYDTSIKPTLTRITFPA